MENFYVSDSEAAWSAGAFDGEGCVMVKVGGARGGDKVRVTVVNTFRAFCDRFRDLYGGSVTVTEMAQYNSRWRTRYTWEASGKSAVRALRNMLPYLLVKRSQAVLALEFADTLRQGVRHPPEVLNRRAEIARLIKEAKSPPEREPHGLQESEPGPPDRR